MNSTKQKIAYPDRTRGSETAAKMRKRANSLSDSKLAHHFKRAMAVIYGGVGQAAGSRH
jgi:hypothetical protein